MAELYRYFARDWVGLDFSDQSLIDMYNSESYGTELNKRTNGFYVGKQWMGVSISMWKEDRERGHLILSELYDDPNLPNDWLDVVIK